MFDIGHAEVIPIFDQLYVVSDVSPGGIELSLATDRVPQELRPGLQTRTICAVAVDPELFIEQHPVYPGREDFDEVKVEFEKATGKVIVNLEPRIGISNAPREARPPTLPARPPLKLKVAKGEPLTARGRSYKVLNVVPPQDIEGVGHLVGWIELAADPEASP
jgi:hypothetical protein